MNKHLTPGCKTVILINGIPASGKSTVTRQLSATFNLPQLTIDGIKEPFMACFSEIDRSFNRQLGCAAYEVIWSIVGHAPAGCIWLIDAWFGFQPRETLQRQLQQAGVEKVLEIWNRISPELAVSRYASRLQDRRPGTRAKSISRSWLSWRSGRNPCGWGRCLPSISKNRWRWRLLSVGSKYKCSNSLTAAARRRFAFVAYRNCVIT
ncbi:glucokinase [Klebsiella grimontii]|nr:glucokinase [Klebsiella grimontii]